MLGPDERRHAEIVASGRVADPGPLFEALSEGQYGATKGTVLLVPADNGPHAERRSRTASQSISDEGSPPDTGIAGRHRNGEVMPAMQSDQGEYGGGRMVGVPPSASEMVAKLR